MQPTKPGYTTTEFWLTLLTNLGAVVALLAPQLGVKLADPATIKAIAIAAAAAANIVYTLARGHVKAQAAHAQAIVASARPVAAEAPTTRRTPKATRG